MTLFQAFLLGILQGLTEFIPVSSTAHLLIFGNLLGLPADEKTFSFSVIIQLGTVVAMLAFFWKDIWQITSAFFLGIKNKKPFEDLYSRLGWLVIVASIPALIAGYVLQDAVEALFRQPMLEASIRLLTAAVLLALAEWFSKKDRELDSMSWLDAFIIGLMEVIAVFPGASRSGTTIAGGMLRGFDRPSAARFSFLMSGPILLAAGIYQSLQVFNMSGLTEFLPNLVVGFVTAAVVGWLSIKWLIGYLGRRSLYIFAIYCALVGVLLLFTQFI